MKLLGPYMVKTLKIFSRTIWQVALKLGVKSFKVNINDDTGLINLIS